MKIPTDKLLIETPISTMWINDDGIVYSVSKSEKRTLENVKHVVDIYKGLSARMKIYLLADITEVSAIDRKARKYLSEEMKECVQALALVAHSSLAKMISNKFFLLYPQTYPIHYFNTTKEALEWLKNLKKENEGKKKK